MTTDEHMSTGERVKLARKECGISQSELGRRTGLTQPTISDLERGRNASSTELIAIAAALGVNAVWLSTGKGSRHAPDLLQPVPLDRRINSHLVIACSHAVSAYLQRHGMTIDEDDRLRMLCRLYEQFVDTPDKSAAEILSHLSGVMDLLRPK